MNGGGMAYREEYPTRATDGNGSLPIVATQSPKNGQLSWALSRDPVGEITLFHTSFPVGDISGLIGRSALRYDHGGVIGVGRNFMPIPAADE
jgi:hypothetical protein